MSTPPVQGGSDGSGTEVLGTSEPTVGYLTLGRGPTWGSDFGFLVGRGLSLGLRFQPGKGFNLEI